LLGLQDEIDANGTRMSGAYRPVHSGRPHAYSFSCREWRAACKVTPER